MASANSSSSRASLARPSCSSSPPRYRWNRKSSCSTQPGGSRGSDGRAEGGGGGFSPHPSSSDESDEGEALRSSGSGERGIGHHRSPAMFPEGPKRCAQGGTRGDGERHAARVGLDGEAKVEGAAPHDGAED